MTWQEAYKRGTARLQQCGVEEAGADAWILLEEFGKIDRAHYFLRQMEEMPEEARHSYECAIAKRAQRIPVQQITGKQEFCGLEFQDGKLQPELIIGVPVGFVNVVQSKELIMQADVPYIVAKGRKGGSNIAACICNALLYMAGGRE